MNYALALPERGHRPMLYGTRAQLASGSGDVEGYLTLAGCDKRAGTASYALRIVNQSAHPLRARMTCARLRGDSVLAYPLDVHVAPFAISETLLPVRVADVGPYDRAIVQVSGGDIAFSLEAPAPPKRRARSRFALAACAAAALTAGSAFGAAAATPRIGLLAAPDRVFAGAPIDVPYAYAGLGALQYTLQTPDGRQLAAGLAGAREGTLHFSVPANAGRDVTLSVRLSGPFGNREQVRRIAIAPAAPKRIVKAADAPPHISEFALATPVVRAGAPMQVRYVTDARGGEVWLIDDAGRLWARAPVSAGGVTTLNVPEAAAGRSVRAVLHARNGSADAVASLGVTVLPGAVESADAQTPRAGHPPVLTLSSSTASPGDGITVSIAGDHGDARISLADKSGSSVEQGDIPASQNALALTAPQVTGPTTYYVTASITQGVGEQTIVKKILITPR